MLGRVENGIQAGRVENGIGPSIQIVDPGGMDTVDDGVGNGAVPLAELTQQRLRPAMGFSLKHALLENVVEEGVILDVERDIAHCCHLFHDRRNSPAQLSENYETSRR